MNIRCLTMTSLKTGSLLSLSAFLFLSIVPTVAKVVNSVADCNQYLLENKPPQLPDILVDGNIKDQNRYKPICQTYKDTSRFLTLYDTTNKIPVFSAYKYSQVAPAGDVENDWKIEPQLDGKPEDNMEDEEKGKTYKNQAIITDYNKPEEYDRGHLNPSSHSYTTADKESTYTLTNVVPQAKNFNQGRWNKMEKCIKCIMDAFCKDNNQIEAFVVTGAQPGTEEPPLNNKVNVPSAVWSAFCCHYVKKNKKGKDIDMWIASAHWDNNVQGNKKDHLQSQTLTDLQSKLGGAILFPGTKCPLNKKLEDYRIPKITQTCSNCRP